MLVAKAENFTEVKRVTNKKQQLKRGHAIVLQRNKYFDTNLKTNTHTFYV